MYHTHTTMKWYDNVILDRCIDSRTRQYLIRHFRPYRRHFWYLLILHPFCDTCGVSQSPYDTIPAAAHFPVRVCLNEREACRHQQPCQPAFECRSTLNVWEPHQYVPITPYQTVDIALCKIIPYWINTVVSMTLTVEGNIIAHYMHIIHAGEWCVRPQVFVESEKSTLMWSFGLVVNVIRCPCVYTEMFHHAGSGS